MVFKRYSTICLSLIVFAAHAGNLWAGQVITKDTREWAKKALQEEKSLKSVKAQNTLAVLYFQNKSGKEELNPLQKGFALMLITDLSSVKGLQVIERIKLQALVEEIGIGTSGLLEQASAPRVGKLLGAKWMVGGDITGAQKAELQVKSDLLDAPTAKIIGKSASKGTLPELFRIEKDLLFNIIKLLNIKITPEEETRLRKPCSTNSKALFALFEGVDASDRQEYEKAAQLYEKALDDDPNICMADDALNELHNLGLVPLKSNTGELLNSLKDDTSLTNAVTTKDEIRNIKPPSTMNTTTDVNIQVNFP
jgi:TolB-like protein